MNPRVYCATGYALGNVIFVVTDRSVAVVDTTEGQAQDSTYLSGLVYPQRHLQERLYSILPFLAKHGLGLIDDLYQYLNVDCPDHQLAVV